MTMLLIAGLGNPGKQYAATRHNIGFMAVDAIAHRHSFSSEKSKFQGLIQEGSINGQSVMLVKPQTFMNLSGNAVRDVMKFYKIALEDIIVIHDELDLPLGKLRIKTGGGHGGHNGLRSLDAQIGNNYHRIRLGIDHPGDKNRVSDYVLSPFAVSERPEVEKLLDAIAHESPYLAAKDMQRFMSAVVLALTPPQVKG